MTTQRPRVLFVDDEPHLLSGIRRSLRALAQEWEMTFVDSGAQAMAVMDAQPFDAVVTDMRMPGVDGAELLAWMHRSHPGTARIVLSGQAERSAVLVAAASAHQFLTKPCDAERLGAVVGRVLAVQRSLTDPALRDLLSGVRNLPTLPAVYEELMAVASAPDTGVNDVARVLASDVATSAEILKLTNSAFFGLPRRIETVTQAVAMLGLDNIQALVVAGTTFRSGATVPGLDTDVLRRIALQRAAMVRRIGATQGWTQDETRPIALAAMLRDVGVLVLATGHPETAVMISREHGATPELLDDPVAVHEREKRLYGCSVTQASAYLLGLWGFSDRVVHTVGGQPVPADSPGSSPEDLALGYAHQRSVRPASPVAAELVSRVNGDRLAAWGEACDDVLAARGADDAA